MKFILRSDIDWELHLPRHVPLDGKNANGFRLKNLLEELAPYKSCIRSIVADRNNVEFWELVENCTNANRLTINFELKSDDVEIHTERLAQCPQVTDLSLNKCYLTDDDLAQIIASPKLENLSIPNALITTAGLKRMAESNLSLKSIHLPESFAKFSSMIEELGLAKEIFCTGKPDLFQRVQYPLDPVAVAQNFDELLRHAEFPRPADSPRRPEDEMLYRQRQSLLSLARALRSEDATELLKKSLERTQLTDSPVAKLIAEAPKLRSTYATLKDETDLRAHFKDWQQVGEIYGLLAEMNERSSNLENALEFRVREAVWASMTPLRSKRFPTDQDLSALCERIADSDKTRTWKGYFFLVADRGQTKFESPTHPMAEWYPGKPQGVPVLAPLGTVFATIRSERELKVRTATRPELTVTKKSGEQLVKLPPGIQIAYVDRTSFPITVETNGPSASVDRDEIYPFALGPPKDGAPADESVEFDPTAGTQLIEFDLNPVDEQDEPAEFELPGTE